MLYGKRLLEVDKDDFRRQCDVLARQYGLRAGDVLRLETGLWGADLAKNPLPRKKGTKSIRKRFSDSLERDIARAFRIVDTAVKPSGCQLWGQAVDPETHHKAARERRTGRVRREFGRGGHGERPIIKASKARRLVREQKKHLGKLSAGWLPMVRKFRGPKPASWISRHNGRGSAIDRVNKEGHGFTLCLNRVHYAGRFYNEVAMEWSAERRERHMDRLLKMKVEQVAKLFNRMKSQGRI